jgi:hypothetical protein
VVTFILSYTLLNLLCIYAYINEYHKLISEDNQEQAGEYLSLVTICYFGLFNFFSLMS